MRNSDLHLVVGLAAVLVSSVLAHPSVASCQSPPPIHPLGRVLRTSPEPFASISQVRAVSGGRVIVNDIVGRRVVLLDSTLRVLLVIADSTSGTASAYSSRVAGIIAYRGDSTLFVDPVTFSMLVIDPSGRIVRTIAAPSGVEAGALVGGPFGAPGFDSQGRLVYRVMRTRTIAPPPAGAAAPQSQPNDSAMVTRLDLVRRTRDTVAVFAVPRNQLIRTRGDNGMMTATQIVNPLPWVDDWALLSSGRVAIVRGHEYRVDIFDEAENLIVSQRIPFDWHRLSDAERAVVIDSTRRSQIAQNATAARSDSALRQRVAPEATLTPGTGAGGATALNISNHLDVVSPDELPDYRPPFQRSAIRTDMDGNLWIRTSVSVGRAAVYDVISERGELTDRVLVPDGRVIAGFGPGGIVYMGVVDGTVTRLERARIR
jgi:hypothetical protein